jgi:hypothetical protein
MSGGLNKAFMRNPEAFMRAHPINITDFSELAGTVDSGLGGGNRQVQVMTGVHDFDLEIGSGRIGGINLRRFGDRAKGAGDLKSNRIRAYWFPWKRDGESHIQLGTLADYFFTSALGGCRIQIGAGANPLVMHIAGALTQQQRNQLGQPASGPGSRRFSFTTDYPISELAFPVGKAYGRFMRHWTFFAQGIGFDEEGKLIVTALHAHGNGVVVL